MDVTVHVEPLAEAAAAVSRLLTARSLQPAQAGVLLRADGAGLLLVAADGELTVRLRVPATVHHAGEIVVSRRAFADTAGGLEAPDARLCAESGRLAIRVPGARFALPALSGAHPPTAELPPVAGSVTGADLRGTATAVAGAASREHALPMFTGVRVRAGGDRLSLLATDRFRLAAATLPWSPAAPQSVPSPGMASLSSPGVASLSSPGVAPLSSPGMAPLSSPGMASLSSAGAGVEALVPAATLARAAQQLSRAGTVRVHAGEELFGLSWDGGELVTATLGAGYPDAQFARLLDVSPECSVEIDADGLAHAVDRAARYAGPHGRVELQAIDGALLVRAADPLSGESEETVKATVEGAPVTRSYQARFLTDALRAFAHHPVRLRVQEGLRATAVSAAPPAADLTYLIVPMRPPTAH